MTQALHITHDGGNLSEYETTVVDGGDLSVSTQAAIIGSHGLQIQIDDTTSIWARVDFTQLAGSDGYNVRFYLNPNSLSIDDGKNHWILDLKDSSTDRIRVRLGYDDTDGYWIKVKVRDDDNNITHSDAINISNLFHYIEVTVTFASSAVASDATVTVYVDGSQQLEITGLDIYDLTQPDRLEVGAIQGVDATTSGTYYIDDIVIIDEPAQIGPAILFATGATVTSPTQAGAVESPTQAGTVTSPGATGTVRSI